MFLHLSIFNFQKVSLFPPFDRVPPGFNRGGVPKYSDFVSTDGDIPSLSAVSALLTQVVSLAPSNRYLSPLGPFPSGAIP
jgi:hypothetical protein